MREGRETHTLLVTTKQNAKPTHGSWLLYDNKTHRRDSQENEFDF